MGHRLVILMAMGLSAMYMLHLLAQDWNRIRQPLPPAVTRFLTDASRNLDNYITGTRGKRDASHHQQQFMAIAEAFTGTTLMLFNRSNDKNNDIHLIIDWKRILSRDPFKCLQSFICQLISENVVDVISASGTDSTAQLWLDFLLINLPTAPLEIKYAFKHGLLIRKYPNNYPNCYSIYPLCLYSAKTMLNILSWFAKATNQMTIAI